MNPSPRPALLLLGMFGAALHLVGCRAQETAVIPKTIVIEPAVTNAQTNAPNPTNTLGLAHPAGATNATDQAAVTKTFGEKLQSGEARLSEGVAGIISLAQGGVGEEILLAYVQNHPAPFHLSSDEILYLTDLGLPETVISAMIKHTGGRADVAGTVQTPATNQVVTLPNAPSYAVTATPEFEAGVAPAPVPYVAQVPQVEYNYFYSSLAPYGSWMEVPDYGWAWQPTVAVVDPFWRPYCHRGRWIYSDCGWYWHSDYSWGWAPFHYGRWHSYPSRGWFWIPDRTWGPAWVTWRYSDAYCGWAPLPPGAFYDSGFGFRYHSRRVGFSFDFGFGSDYYTFIPTSRFCDPFPWRHRLGGTQVVNVFNRTTIINNYSHNANKLVINEGVDRARISAITRSEIRKVEVRDAPLNPVRPVKVDRLERDGSQLVVYRPRLPAASPGSGKAQEIRKPGASSANLGQTTSPTAGSGPSPALADNALRRAEGRAKASTQPGAAGTENRNGALPVTTVPSRRTSPNRETNLRESSAPSAVTVSTGQQNGNTPLAGTIRAMNSSSPTSAPNNPAAPIVPNNVAATRNMPATQPTFKSADEPRGAPSSGPPMAQTPARPVLRREPASSAANNPTVVPSRPATTSRTISRMTRPEASDATGPSQGIRPRSDLETRLAEFQNSARSTLPSEAPRNAQPVIRSRGLTEQSISSPYTPPPRTPYVIPNAPSYTPQVPSYTSQPAAQTPQYRQELANPPTTVYRERRSYAPPASSPSYQSPSTYSAPESPSLRTSRGSSDYSPPSRSGPSPSGSISITPSSRQNSPPPTQIQPSQLTPSNRSSSSSGNTVPSRSSGSSSGRERQER